MNISEYVASEFGKDDKDVVLFFDVPKKFRKDFELFILGKYSEFSAEYKELLVKSYGKGRASGFSAVTKLPQVSIYDVISPLKETKRKFEEILNVSKGIEIKEVFDPPDLMEEEFKYEEE